MSAAQMTYDPNLRRDTPLALELKDRIGRRGPIPISEFVGSCLNDSRHGYYHTQDAIGLRGDFTTAPEISQVFGELIGLWCVVVWQQMGAPSPCNLIELGPGRGTMMRDVLRVAANQPGFASAVKVSLVESSERLRAIQTQTLKDAAIPAHHVGPDGPPPGPAIVIANEFLDCLPVGQIVRAIAPDGQSGWFQRTVACDAAGHLQFGQGGEVKLHARWSTLEAPAGTILEQRSRLLSLAKSMVETTNGGPLAVLMIDYGHPDFAFGDTLQAVRAHATEHPLTSPGEADVTTQVCFAEVADAFQVAGLAVDGPLTQAEFLGALGIVERASKLMTANPGKVGEIETGIARLLAPGGMGSRFKAIGMRSPGLPALPGFPAPAFSRDQESAP
jgi:NADH dehydrogenase [ubiquinone] 1 alpha subcomplex assembly factor 7